MHKAIFTCFNAEPWRVSREGLHESSAPSLVSHSTYIVSHPPQWLQSTFGAFPTALMVGYFLAHLSWIKWEQYRKTFWYLVKTCSAGKLATGLLWQPAEQMHWEGTMLSVRGWEVCLCVHMSACSTEEGDDITTRKRPGTPHNALGWSHKPPPSFTVKCTPVSTAIAISRQHRANPFHIVWINSVLVENSPQACFHQVLLGNIFLTMFEVNRPGGIHRWKDTMALSGYVAHGSSQVCCNCL
jgi:hypothetical protein